MADTETQGIPEEKETADKTVIDGCRQLIANLNSRVRNLDNLVVQVTAEKDAYRTVLMDIVDKLVHGEDR